MKIGYACLTSGVRNTKIRSCTKKYATYDNLIDITGKNLESLENILLYNEKQGISLFRISSDIVPFGSDDINNTPWEDIFRERFSHLGDIIKRSGQRVSMHPGQYTVLNSPDDNVFERAIKDLVYHEKILRMLGTGTDSKIILHIGGVYGDKKTSAERFIKRAGLLDEKIKSKIAVENDDRCYNASDVLYISEKTGIPAVFDNLHHEINYPDKNMEQFQWIEIFAKTWKKYDGNQKIHYSQQKAGKRSGSHSETIDVHRFETFYKTLKKPLPDIMLEVKDKNISALKCINTVTEDKSIVRLEEEWSRYKYKILEHDPSAYFEIRGLLKDKKSYPVKEFYEIIDRALAIPSVFGNELNAVFHVAGYMKDVADDNERKKLGKLIISYEKQKIKVSAVKKALLKLAEKYKIEYLLNSYYFDMV